MDKYDKMSNETLNKEYADFLDRLKKKANKKKSYDCDLTVSDKTTMDNDYVISMDPLYKYGQVGTTTESCYQELPRL